jgi:hypothetical protein
MLSRSPGSPHRAKGTGSFPMLPFRAFRALSRRRGRPRPLRSRPLPTRGQSLCRAHLPMRLPPVARPSSHSSIRFPFVVVSCTHPTRFRKYSAVSEPSASSNSRGVLSDSTSPPAGTPPIRMRGAGLGKASMLATPCTASRCTENRCPRGSPGIPVSLLTSVLGLTGAKSCPRGRS